MKKQPFQFQSRRSPVYAIHGMLAASQPLAVQAGITVLMKGGNAADASVATAAALNVTEPASTGLGGDCFALYYEGSTANVTALNGSGRAPKNLTLELLARQGFKRSLPPYHAHTVTVPGTCAAWCALVQRYGNLSMGEILAPAISLAEEGFPVAPISAHNWKSGEKRLQSNSPNGGELLLDDRAPRTGEIFRNQALANSLKTIAESGSEGFYQGEIAARIAQAVQRAGGVMTTEDIAQHESTWEVPISTCYKGIRVHECPPNGQGLAVLLALNMLSFFDLRSLGEALSPMRLHVLIEALRLAFADVRWYVADPACVPIPLSELLSKSYAEHRAKSIDLQKANLRTKRGEPISGSDTVYFSVVDGDGNACSFVNSNYMGFGTGLVPEGTGFSLQNRGLNFSLNPSHPNSLAPLKRPYHTIIPAMATRESDGSLYASLGVMGGFMQPQGHVQVLLGLVEDELDPQLTLDSPRVCLQKGVPGGGVAVEEGISKKSIVKLEQLGHNITLITGYERSLFGRGQIIVRDPASAVLCGGSDPRADGCAMGY